MLSAMQMGAVITEISMPKPKLRSMNPRVFFDIHVDNTPIGRIVFELYKKQCPKTVENFRCICTGEYVNEHGKRLWYKGTVLHSIFKGWAVVGGDIINNNGTSGESIYGKFFEDENFDIRHDQPGILSTMSFKNGTNNSQFFISLMPAPWLDVQNVAFGKVVSGMDVIRRIDQYGSEVSGIPTRLITIGDCGQL